MEKDNYTHVRHEFNPVFDSTSRILILGTLPSVKSREQNFYYGHPQNRFWKLLARICESKKVPETIEEKKTKLAQLYALRFCFNARLQYLLQHNRSED